MTRLSAQRPTDRSYRFSVRQFQRMLASGVFKDQKVELVAGRIYPIPCYLIVRLRGAKTVAEVWTEPTGKGNNARYAEVVRYRADAGESIPIEMDGQPFGQVPVAGLSPS